jgi:hypothetical protein
MSSKPSTNPQVGVAQYRLALRDAAKKIQTCNFQKMFNVVEGLIKDSKYVTPSHINRLWPLIVSLVDVGCTNLTISNKQLMEAIKYEFCQDATAQTPKPFEIQCSNAADHVCSILYVLRAFYRESKADEVDMERGNRCFKKNW